MGSEVSQISEERMHVDRCLRGDGEALNWLREKCHGSLTHILLSRGASRTETEDVLADLWADCLGGANDRPSLLEKFNGRCQLLNWLATVATRRWIDWKRKQAREVAPAASGDPEDWPSDELDERPTSMQENVLVDILRRSLQTAFGGCPPETMVLLRLRYLYDVSQRELVRMLGWHESKVSRTLSKAMREIEAATLREIKKQDPWLRLTWQDFLDLCDTQRIEFL